jgi:hypothetical protein
VEGADDEEDALMPYVIFQLKAWIVVLGVALGLTWLAIGLHWAGVL